MFVLIDNKMGTLEKCDFGVQIPMGVVMRIQSSLNFFVKLLLKYPDDSFWNMFGDCMINIIIDFNNSNLNHMFLKSLNSLLSKVITEKKNTYCGSVVKLYKCFCSTNNKIPLRIVELFKIAFREEHTPGIVSCLRILMFWVKHQISIEFLFPN